MKKLFLLLALVLTTSCASAPALCTTQACEHVQCVELAKGIANRMQPDGARRMELIGKFEEFYTSLEDYLHGQGITCEDALARERGHDPLAKPAEPNRRLQKLERE